MTGIKKEDCCGCAACSQICPAHCIEMRRDREGFLHPQTDASRCIRCGLCRAACPVLNPPEKYMPRVCYAAYHRQDDVREKSSSGGIFAALANQVLRMGGTVYGAAFSDDYRSVRHIRASCEAQLEKLYTSKYMQSTVGKTCQQVKKDLHSGLPVLFCGTPCQVAGLRSFLHTAKADSKGLLCVDFVCHGVPSVKLWQIYTEGLIRKYGHGIDWVNFRSKSRGWTIHSLLTVKLGGKTIQESAEDNPYYKAFLSDLCLRKSCYNCRFKGEKGASDLTLADFWGIEAVAPEMDDRKGTSLVLVNTLKGQEFFNSLQEELCTREVDYDQSIRQNPSRLRSWPYNRYRDRYLSRINSRNFAGLTRKYTETSRLKKILRKVKRKIKRGLLFCYETALNFTGMFDKR